MRAKGVRRMVLDPEGRLLEIELDAPNPFAAIPDDAVDRIIDDARYARKDRDESLCAICQEQPKGHPLNPQLCRGCALKVGGVQGLSDG
jgi:hypothetical protein